MISYCVVSYRPTYSILLIDDLVRKTTCPYEILVWINTLDDRLVDCISAHQKNGAPVRIVGVTPNNIGMNAFKNLFSEAKYDIVTQLDDDVVRVSCGIAQAATDMFQRHPDVCQIVADVWQDKWTNGARPDMSVYKPVYKEDGLFDGPIDGWFSMYRKSIMPLLMVAPYSKYVYLGSWVRGMLHGRGQIGLLCTKFKVMHLTGPIYSSLFGMLDVEIAKYRSVGRPELAEIYEKARSTIPDAGVLSESRDEAYRSIDSFVA